MHPYGKDILPIGFQQRGPLLCESLVELENLRAACDPYRELNLGQAELLAYPVELSSVHFRILHRLNYCVQIRYMFHSDT